MPANREMPYPYTLGAQIRQFPFRFFWRNQPVYRMMIYGWLVSLPIIWQIHKAGNYLYSRILQEMHEMQ